MKVGGVVRWKGKHSRHVTCLLDASRLFPPNHSIGTGITSAGSFPRSNKPSITIGKIDSWSLHIFYGTGKLLTSLDQFFCHGSSHEAFVQ